MVKHRGCMSNGLECDKWIKKKGERLERLSARKKREWLDSGSDHGFVRLFAPASSRSIVYPLTIRSTVQDVCSILGFEGLYLQIGGLHIRSLPSSARPLHLQNEILTSIGYERLRECMEVGDATHLTHIFCFYMGLPEHGALAGTSNEILVAKCLVRKGRLLQKWNKRRCILYNGTIRIEHENEDDEMLLLSRYRVEVTEGNKGKYLRLTDGSQLYNFLFEAIGEMNLWLSRVVQTQMTPTCDLSDQRLLFLPDRLFSVGVERHIVSLNLRRNSLILRPNKQIRAPLLGWLDDVHRLINLRSLNIGDNALNSFPPTITRLTSLTELILCGNRIAELPIQIGLLHKSVLLQFLS
ncbi:unnamed protein product [Anisakis simplex]|uniref:PH domain-containing protein n=1 Tax=Anisakis simplex TaxID=6269 RepID=A0A0M3KAE2_ANISI|nr:unnamed protein product [Anisakis simplex]